MTGGSTRQVPLIGMPGRVAEARLIVRAPDDPTTPKGSRTYNYVFTKDMKAGAGRRMLAWRIKGEEVGNHFHSRVPNKDPEAFEILYGDIDVHLADVYGGMRIIELRIPLGQGPVALSIPAYVLHRFVVRSAQALFEELQESPMDPGVTFSAEEFALLAERFSRE